MKRQTFTLLISSCAIAVSSAQEWITIGHAGNAADKSGFGAVAYEFQIMQHEVTCAEYVAFLNATATTDPYLLWNPKMDGEPLPAGRDDIRSEQGSLMRKGGKGSYQYAIVPGREKLPIVNVNHVSVLRFANWLHGGETEIGAYDISTQGAQAKRSAEAKVWLPSEDEWHKAAYYDAEVKRYWLYAARSDERPQSSPPNATLPNAANFFWADGVKNGMNKGYAVPQTDYYKPGSIALTPVGSYPMSPSAYGTLDQTGNVWEWTEGIMWKTKRVIRGGSWFDEANALRSTTRTSVLPTTTFHDTGFRLARSLPTQSP